MAGPPTSWRTIPMRSRLRRRLARGIVVLPLTLAGCSGIQQAFYESDPAVYDFPDFHAALDAQSRGDDAAAVRDYQRLYDNTKHPIAEVQLGRRYAEGQGVPKDTAKALQLLQSAYDKDWSGRAEAAYYLGRMYDDGNGVPQDKQKAFELFDYAWSKGSSRPPTRWPGPTMRACRSRPTGAGRSSSTARRRRMATPARTSAWPSSRPRTARPRSRSTTRPHLASPGCAVWPRRTTT